MIVDIFIPCMIDQISPETGFNMVKVLDKLGCSVYYNTEQTCCGQPAFHAGFRDDAKGIGEKFIKEFLNDRYIVSPGTACSGYIKNQYPEMFHNSVLHNQYKQVQRNMYEFSDFLVNVLRITNIGAILNAKAVYMDTCTGLRNYGIHREPRVLLEKVRGLELKEIQPADVCCGFGGAFSVNQAALSTAMAKTKVDYILKTGAEYIIASEFSCLMHLSAYIRKNNIPLKTLHIADVLATGWD
jgi:L-lactate dehydrogenase complex protein LldE